VHANVHVITPLMPRLLTFHFTSAAVDMVLKKTGRVSII